MSKITSLFDNELRPHPTLLKIFEIVGLEREDDSLASIRNATQLEWYQKGKLRAEINEEHYEHRKNLMLLLRSLGFVRKMSLEKDLTVDGVLLLGGTVVAVRKRMAYLRDEAARSNLAYDWLDMLGSERPLMDREKKVMFDHANPVFPFSSRFLDRTISASTTEAGMMELVWQQCQTEWLTIRGGIVINTPLTDGRATTEDTLNDWKRHRQMFGKKIVVVSSQPYVSFQHGIVTKALGDEYDVTTIGYGAGPNIPITGYLDNIAKLIYEEAKAAGV